MNNGAMRMFRRIFIGIPIELYRWFRAIAVLKGSDMLIMTGTGMLGDFGILPLDLHYDILRWSVMAKLCRCKLLFVSVGAGPIRHPLSRRFVKAALTLANYRSYRDSFSKEYLKSVGFERKGDTVYPDLAFSLPRAIIPGNHHRDDQGAVVGVGLMTYFNKLATSENDETIYRDYLTKVAAFVNWLLDQNYTVRLLIGDAVYDKRVREDLGELLKGVTSTDRVRKIIDEPASSFDDVLSQLAKTDIVVASRFHNVLLALMVTKLVVAISYHEKVDSLMNAVGMTAFCQDIEHVDIDKLIGQFFKLEQDAEILRPQIERKTEAYRRALDEQYDHIFKNV